MTDHATLAERIAAGEVIHSDSGHRLLLAWPLPISGDKRITVQYLCRSERPQLLHVAIRGGRAIANGMTTTSFVIRCTSTPGPIAFDALPDDELATIYFWNGWTVAGIDQAWLGNAALCELATDGPTGQKPPGARDESTERHRLACSDGVGAALFSDLVATITVAER